MRSEVVGLDVEQVNRLADGRHLIQLLGVFAQGWVLVDEALVGLEVDHIDLRQRAYHRLAMRKLVVLICS